jgi:nitroreductase
LDLDELERLMSRQRAVRNFDPSRPVDDETIEQLLRLATFAPNGGNRQLWRFIVVRDAAVKARLATIYGEEAQKYLGRPLQGQTPWTEVPVLVVFASEAGGGGASIFPAVQNFLLAASAMGLGSVLTTLWQGQDAEVRRILSVPENIQLHAILPLGWPDRRYGANKRRPVSEIAYRDRFGESW